MTDLQDLGLITISRQAINPNDFDIHRIRNAYTLNMDTLKRPARRRWTRTTPPRWAWTAPKPGPWSPRPTPTRRPVAAHRGHVGAFWNRLVCRPLGAGEVRAVEGPRRRGSRG